MLCRKCGAQIDDNATECKFCGEKFEAAQAKEDAAMAAETAAKGEEKPAVEAQRSTHEIFEENEKKRRAQTEKVVDEKKQQLNEINERREQKKRREKRNKIIVIALICVAVAAAAAIGAYYFKTKDADPDIVTSTAAPTASARPTLTPITTDEPEVSATPEATAAATQSAAQTNTASGNSHSYSGGQSSTGANNSASSSNTVSSSTAGSGGGTPARATSAPAVSSSNTASSSTGGSRLGTGAASYNVPTKLNGNSSNKLTAELAIGGHVVYDQSAKKTIMSFAVGNTTYYAYVADGSYTSGVNGKYMTVTAVPTSGKYNGNTVYEITKLTYYDLGDYVIPDSGIRLLTEQELNKYTKAQLGIARNEIYARHGRDFKTKEYKDYFSAKSWYKVDSRYNYENESANLNKIEQKNIDMILRVEASK